MKTLGVAVAVMAIVIGPDHGNDSRGVRLQPDQNQDRPTSMLALYADNRERGIPNYITEDFLVMAYAKTLGVALERMEISAARDLRVLLDGLRDGVRQAPAGETKTANEDFLDVLRVLLGADAPLSDRARAELRHIQDAAGVARSPLMRQRIDYTRFRVRGDYARTPERSRYFLATGYAGAALFPLRESAATGVSAEDAEALTAQAAMLTRIAWADPALRARVVAIERRLSWMFGAPDDLSVADYAAVMQRSSLTERSSGLRAALRAAAAKRRPKIVGGIVDGSQLEPAATAADVLLGWRLLPQRATPDAVAAQELVFDRVGTYKGGGSPVSATVVAGRVVKGFPLVNELMALLGSPVAAAQLAAADEKNYEGYAAASARARRALHSTAISLPSAHVALIEAQLAPRSSAHRRLNTALALWTRLRHLSLAYTKQSYSVAGKGISREPERRAASIDPNPSLYAGLAALAARISSRIGADVPELRAFRAIAGRCAAIAGRAGSGAPLPRADVVFLNDLDSKIGELFEEEDVPIVADVHTDPSSGMVLQEGLGLPAIVTRAAGGVQTRGAASPHVEFKRAMAERLDDEQWLALLKAGFEPAVEAERRMMAGAGGR
jgi:uncharacterized protein DUF3160